MKALVYDRYGPPEGLRLENVPVPQPGEDEVLVRLRATAINSWDWDMLVGTVLGRVMGPFRPPHKVLGGDIAGVVEAAGAQVDGFRPGDKVFGDLTQGRWGGFAAVAVAKKDALAPMPDGISFEQAATVPQAALLALQALRKHRQIGPGDKVLINGAGGGVGMYAIQFAKLWGAEVTAVDIIAKHNHLRALGADHVLDHRAGHFTQQPETYDHVLDNFAHKSVGRYQRALRPGGAYVAVGGYLRSLLQIVIFGRRAAKDGQNISVLGWSPRIDQMSEVAKMIADGALRVVIAREFALTEGVEALRMIGEGRVEGKIVFAMKEPD